MTSPGFVAEGHFCALRNIEAGDYPTLRSLEQSADLISRYRHRGVTVPPEQYSQLLWQGVQCQFIVVSRQTNASVGVVTAYDADFRLGTIKIAGFVIPEVVGDGWPIEGFSLLIDYLFRVFPLRKVVAEVPTPNLAPLRGVADRVFTQEGLIRGGEYIEGAFVDVVLLGCFREEWRQFRDKSTLASQVARLNDQAGLTPDED